MNSSLLLIAALLLPACTGDSADDDEDGVKAPTVTMDGRWTGTCSIQASGYTSDADFDLTLDESGDTGEGSTALTGSGTYEFSGETWQATATGSRSFDVADLIITGLLDEFEQTMVLEGKVVATTFSGDCNLGQGSGTFSLEQQD